MEQEKDYREAPAAEKKTPHPGWIAGMVLSVALIAAVVWNMPFVRYHCAGIILERGDYAEARQIFASLGGYKDSAKQVEEAEKGFLYLDAQALLDQGKYSEALAVYETLGNFSKTRDKIRETKYLLAVERIGEEDWKTAQELLSQIGPYRDTAALLEQLDSELRYKQAWAYMVTEQYENACEEFRMLGGFKDAAEKAEECRRLHEAKTAYDEGKQQYDDGKWLSAYRTLSAIREMDYRDTLTLLEEISAVAEERLRHYAQLGDYGKTLAFLQLMEEIDAGAVEGMRQALAPAETFEKDQSYYLFDLERATFCTMDTPPETIAETILYMLLHGQTDHTILCQSKLDQDEMQERAFDGEDLFCEILPDYGSIYQVYFSVWPNGIELDLDCKQEYSVYEQEQHKAECRAFCEQSLQALTESGLLNSTMSRRQKAEIINNWVGFYLTYDTSLKIHDAGVAVAEAEGVCEAFAGLYHRMCNLAGIPTYGQVGVAGSGTITGMHIWLFHVDEEGNIFYADPTWADPWDLDFTGEQERPTVADFAEKYLERCMMGGVMEYRYPNYRDGAGQKERMYLWSGSLWSTHKAERSTEEIMAAHRLLTGQAGEN